MSFLLAGASTVVLGDVNLYGRVAVGLENDQFQNTDTPGGGSAPEVTASSSSQASRGGPTIMSAARGPDHLTSHEYSGRFDP